MVYSAMIETPLGPLRAEADEAGLTLLQFDAPRVAIAANDILDQLREELVQYFAGERTDFSVPVSPSGTNFQKRVWNELQRIRQGVTISYVELAQRIGQPTASRAVARANGANPICILIPCHRVIGKDGTLTGYSAGLERKRFLLALEQRDAVDTAGFRLEVEQCSC